MTDKRESIYRINFTTNGECYEIFAKYISYGDLMGFLAVEDILFGENTSLVVDPSEERLRTEFKGVNCTFIPLHTINRIDEVEKTGVAKIRAVNSSDNVTYLPSSLYQAPKK